MASNNDNLALLPKGSDVSLRGIASHLGQRYLQYPNGQTYTSVGTRVLVSLNPLMATADSQDSTAQKYVDDYRDTSPNRKELPPHIFKIAEQAYLHMRQTRLNQTIVFTGETGSGKTEQRRLAMRLFSLIRSQSKKDTKIHQRVHCADIVLEAFTHAKTSEHNNASRIGVYYELQYDQQGRTAGMNMLTYMLEKSRLTDTPNGERNFHILYYLANGATAEERATFGLLDAQTGGGNSFGFLNAPGTVQTIPGFDDAEQFRELVGAMSQVGMGSKIQSRVFGLLSAILNLSNLQFANESQDGPNAANVRNQQLLEHIANQLGVDTMALEEGLTRKTQRLNRERYTAYLDGKAARERRDDLARTLYSLLLNWVVEYINNKISSPDSKFVNCIGMVDLPGYQQLGQGNFDSLCTNYANECLHQFFLRKTLDDGADEYRAEGLESASAIIEYKDDTSRLDLFAHQKYGLFPTMDRQANEFNGKTNRNTKKGKKKDNKDKREFDTTLPPVEASRQLIRTFAKYQRDQGSSVFSLGESKNELNNFSIEHYWGDISYSVDDFVEKNTDPLSTDFVLLFRGDSRLGVKGSNNGFISGLFNDRSVIVEDDPHLQGALSNAQALSVPARQPSMYRKTPGAKVPAHTKKVTCVVTQLYGSINDMLRTVDNTLAWFVLCFRPNHENRAQKVDDNYLLNQVTSYALDEVVHRKQFEFTVSMRHADFCKRYDIVFKQNLAELDQYPDEASKCDHLRIALSLPINQFAIGTTKVFLNYTAWRALDDPVRAEERSQQAAKSGGAGGILTTSFGGKDEILGEQSQEGEDNEHNRNPSIFSGPSYGASIQHSNDNLVLGAQPPGTYSSPSGSPNYGGATLPHPRAVKSRVLGGGPGDTRSYYSDDDYNDNFSRVDDIESERGGFLSSTNFRSGSNTLANIGSNEKYGTTKSGVSPGTVAGVPEKEKLVEDEEDEGEEDQKKMSSTRRVWLWYVWATTFWVPSPLIKCCGGRKRKDERIAWREKLALCLTIAFSCLLIIFWIAVFGLIICPHQKVYSTAELGDHNTKSDAFISIRGEVFDINGYNHPSGIDYKYLSDPDRNYLGKDQSDMFPLQLSFVCPGLNINPTFALQTKPNLYTAAYYHDHRYWRHPDGPGYNYYQYRLMRKLRDGYSKGHIGYDPKEVAKQGLGNTNGKGTRYWAIVNNDIFDLTIYINSNGGGVPYVLTPKDDGSNTTNVPGMDFFDKNLIQLFKEKAGSDITSEWNSLAKQHPKMIRDHYRCFRSAFYAGIVDKRKSVRCYVANYLLLAFSVIIVSIIFFKFLASLQLTSRRDPEERENFVILNVPCYTEGEESLKKTIESLTSLKYDDKRKLMFIICDGMIMGSGNDIPTPRIVLNILGVDPEQDPEPLSFLSLGEGRKQHNMGKVYSGLTEHAGHVVPYMVVVKCGTPDERNRPGNRGKRDSQILLMRFFNKVHFDLPMTPLELEMYHQIKNVIGVDPNLYEFVLMIDADTYVFPDSLIRLVSSMVHDSKTMGICGETQLANAKKSWITMMQVYEYFISHHMAKSFESLFGSVTCLPGCFSMYRMKTAEGKPLLIARPIIEDYSVNKVETLHMKNLLHLGEDRYLTTLMLKHFPYFKNKFTPSAQCRTNAPDSWKILLSQRRRWINSTVHNLFELVFIHHLCGFCCFSMRFIVMVDLISTMVMPATVVYLGYLIYTLVMADSNLPYVSLYLLAAIYGLQALVFILRRQWQHIGWMIVYLLATPLFAFMIPVYSFWHFDDFSWGKTRVIIGESGRKHVYVVDEQKFDPSTIPVRKWSEYEKEVLWETGTQSHHDTESVSQFGGAPAMSVARPGSAVGNYPRSMSRFFENNTTSVYMDNPYPYNMGAANLSMRGPRQSTFEYIPAGSDSGRMTPMGFSHPMMGPTDTMSAYDPATMAMMMPGTSATPVQPLLPPYTPGSQMPMMPDIANTHSFDSASSPIPMPAPDHHHGAAVGVPLWPSGASDEQVRQTIVQIIQTSDLMNITKKQVREQVIAQFHMGGEEAKGRRKLMNDTIGETLQSIQ
ncbi:hypothetical protein H4219_003652 [Mycoemilia scoparia]|uniref:chitin synthase n=1 Tax=Mycoemilia scoparia TaxID=417184 RepID=A0A9W7ZU72_9FUNG|nr:hypothetical protein H4219_003652 [Mycoemilia scoparia]